MEEMTFLHTSRRTFNNTYEKPGDSWSDYVRGSNMQHLTETVSLDSNLNKVLITPDFNNPEDWNCIHKYGGYITGLYTSLGYVLEKTQTSEKYNLMTVMIEPYKDCGSINVYGYEFLGYDLVDKGFNISALTNCGGFPETFDPTDLNQFGLIDRYVYAYDIKRRLLENNPGEFHADTHVVAIWRDEVAGR